MVTATGLDEDQERLWHLYRDLYVLLADVLRDQLLNDSGLSAPEFGVLNSLPTAVHEGIRIRDICAILDWDWSRVSHLVRRMEKRGLVGRHHCEDDARGTEVRITDAGRAALEDAAPKHWDAVRRHFMDGLTSAERKTLTKLLGRIYDNLVGDLRDVDRFGSS